MSNTAAVNERPQVAAGMRVEVIRGTRVSATDESQGYLDYSDYCAGAVPVGTRGTIYRLEPDPLHPDSRLFGIRFDGIEPRPDWHFGIGDGPLPAHLALVWEEITDADLAAIPDGWQECTEAHFYDMLGAVPPEIMFKGGFLVGEPMNSCPITGNERFEAFRHHGEGYQKYYRPLTVEEFKERVA